MLIDRILFRCVCAIGDMRTRRKKISEPCDVELRQNMPYGKHGKWNLLDVYCPKGADRPLPTIVNIHGGGYVCGSKDTYQHYCMNLAQRGFAVVNFNYRLVPKISFPMPVIETNEAMKWVCSNAGDHCIDLNNIFFVGDSAGAQIASQYAAIVANPEYAKLFELAVPDFKLKAVALNCGMYENFHEIDTALPGLLRDYFGKDPLRHGDKINVLKYVNGDFPPAFVMSCANDFLLPCAQPMFEHLRKQGVDCVCEVYGAKEQKDIAHVFHLSFFSDAARECNDAQCDFFRKRIG